MIFIKVYFAGKVTKNGWREEIIKLSEKIQQNKSVKSYREAGVPIGDGYIYNGPYMKSCNHGGFHGKGTHGVGVGLKKTSCCGNKEVLQRRELFNLCMSLVDSSDAIFCYIDDVEAYGTMFELGYAYSKGIPTFVYLSDELDEDYQDDLWFSLAKATQVKKVSSPSEAFEDFKIVFERRRKSLITEKEYEYEAQSVITAKQMGYLMRITSRLEKFLNYLEDYESEKDDFIVKYKNYTIGHFSKELASSCIGSLNGLDKELISLRVKYDSKPEEWVKSLSLEQRELIFGLETQRKLRYAQKSIKELEKFDIPKLFNSVTANL